MSCISTGLCWLSAVDVALRKRLRPFACACTQTFYYTDSSDWEQWTGLAVEPGRPDDVVLAAVGPDPSGFSDTGYVCDAFSDGIEESKCEPPEHGSRRPSVPERRVRYADLDFSEVRLLRAALVCLVADSCFAWVGNHSVSRVFFPRRCSKTCVTSSKLCVNSAIYRSCPMDAHWERRRS